MKNTIIIFAAVIVLIFTSICVWHINKCVPSGWHIMATAPRDGTVVEIRVEGGKYSWISKERWLKKYCILKTTDNQCLLTLETPSWHKVDDINSGYAEDSYSCAGWRPINQQSMK